MGVRSDSVVGLGLQVKLGKVSLNQALARWKRPGALGCPAIPSLVTLCVEACLISPAAAGLEDGAWTENPHLAPFAAVLTTGRFAEMPRSRHLRTSTDDDEEDEDEEEMDEDDEEGDDPYGGGGGGWGFDDGEAMFEDMQLVAFEEKKTQAAVDAAARRILGPKVIAALAPTPEELAAAEGEGSKRKKGKGKGEGEGEIPSPIVATALCDSGPLLDECAEMDGLPEIALFLFLRPTVRTTNNRRGSILVAPPIDPTAVTPLGVFALTKVAHYLRLPLKQKTPAWLLAHCTSEFFGC